MRQLSALLERIAAGADDVFPRVFPLVADAAAAGDPPSREIIYSAAKSLSALVLSVARKLELFSAEFPVAQAGGVFGVSALLDQAFDALVHSAAHGARIHPVEISPARAAALMAWNARPGAAPEGRSHVAGTD